MLNNKEKINSVIRSISLVVKNFSKELHEPQIPQREFFYLNETLRNNFFMLGPYILKFEKKLSKITGSKNVISTNTGSSALHISMKLINVNKSHEILIPTFHYISSVNAVINCGGTPHFVDIEEKTLGVDCSKLEKYLNKIAVKKKDKCINKKTGKIIKAIIVLHAFGHSADIENLLIVCKKYNIIIIEDAAEAIGSYYKKKHLGTYGTIGILSFNGNKTISSGGGGAILTNNTKFAQRARYLISNAKIDHIWKYSYNEVGYNYRMSNLNATLGYLQLKYLKKILFEKRNLFKRYKKYFSKFNFVKVMEEPKKSKSNYWLQTLILNNDTEYLRDKILLKANQKNIKLRPAWELLHSLEHLKRFPKMNLDNALKIHKRIINLPSSCYKIK